MQRKQKLLKAENINLSQCLEISFGFKSENILICTLNMIKFLY